MIATNLNEGATDHYRTPSLLHKHSPILSSLRNRLPNGITDQSERLNKIRNLAQTPIPAGISPVVIGLAITMASLTSYNSAEATFAHLRNPNTLPTTSVLAIAETTDATIELEEHQVEPGETLSEIAEQYDLSVDTILWANNLSIDTPIKAGDTIAILPFDGLMYTAKSGDTVLALASRFQVSVNDITGANRLENSDLAAGQEIFIPTRNSGISYALARGGAIDTEDDNEESDTVVDKSEVDEEPEIIAEEVDEVESNVPAVVETIGISSGTWTHPAPGALLTQSQHGRSGGVDFGGPVGTTIVAADGGVVTKASTGWNGGYGTVVEIDHGDGTWSRYAHLSSLLVSKGASVSAGEAIGYLGNTGKSTGPHLHFEVHGGSNPFASCGYLSRCGY